MRLISSVVLHSAASMNHRTGEVVHLSMNQIDRYHREHNGWTRIGYHWYVSEDGRGEQGRPDDATGAHVGGFNLNSLGLCVSGHGDLEVWNDKQLTEVLRRVSAWCRTYNLDHSDVMGHRETDEHGGPPVHKTCPGKLVDMDRIRELVRRRLQESG